MTTYLMWADFETTGLDPRADTILEAAWTITDENLRMLTPLRSRLCCIDPAPTRRELGGFVIGDRQDAAEGDWPKLPVTVRVMHDVSGLRDALERANVDPVENLRLLTTAADLGRLIKEDFAAVGYNRFEDTMVLAGAGVSHFDNRVFARHLPDMFPLGGDGGRVGYAYWQHDVSVARRVIGEHVWGDLKSGVNNEKAAREVYGCQVVVPSEGYAPVRVNAIPDAEEFGEAPFVFMPDEFTAHRAADDVAQALIDGRILRAATGWSVK